MKTTFALLAAGFIAFVCSSVARAEVDPATQAKIDNEITAAKALAADPAIVAAVKERNAAAAPEIAAMTQEKWKTLTLLDPFVRGFAKNPAGEALKAKKSAVTTEGFISCADGTKVAFLSKPSNWSHKGKPKHDQPMEGKTWQGDIEVDESTGLQQVQVAVPVIDGGKPIGSLVLGLSVSKLKG